MFHLEVASKAVWYASELKYRKLEEKGWKMFQKINSKKKGWKCFKIIKRRILKNQRAFSKRRIFVCLSMHEVSFVVSSSAVQSFLVPYWWLQLQLHVSEQASRLFIWYQILPVLSSHRRKNNSASSTFPISFSEKFPNESLVNQYSIVLTHIVLSAQVPLILWVANVVFPFCFNSYQHMTRNWFLTVDNKIFK